MSESGSARLVLLTCVLASGLAFVDGSVVNVGLPAIRSSLRAGTGELQWVVDGYLLPLAALLLLGGAAGDRFGHRRLLLWGVSVFALASAACAASDGAPMLIAARFAQGVGAAMLMPNSLAILGRTFAGEARGRAIGLWAASGAAASAIGPLCGGALIDAVGWRAMFTINLPIAAAAIALARRNVAAGDGRSAAEQASLPRLDGLGAALATAGLGMLAWGLTVLAGDGRGGGFGWMAAASGGALLGAFLGVEHVRGARAMVPLAMFGSGEFVGLTLLTLLLYGAIGQVFVLLPTVLIDARGFSAWQAGAALLPVPIVLSVLSARAGGLAGRVGSKALLVAGTATVGVGLLLMLRVGSACGYATGVLPALLVLAIGLSGAAAPLTAAVLAAVAPGQTGAASGLNSAASRSGSLIATALVGRVLASHGPALVSAFHAASGIAAVACFAASGCGLVLLGSGGPGSRRAGRDCGGRS